MEVLYIPQLDEVAATGETAATRYRIYTKTPEDGTVVLADKAVNRVVVTDAAAVRFVVPPLVRGQVRDFFLRLVVDADEAPEVTFAAPAGEELSFEEPDGSVLKCGVGVNVFAFTESDEGVFFVNRKQVDIRKSVGLDTCGGTPVASPMEFVLGGLYAGLPVPERDGHEFVGWYTAAEGGVRVEDGDTVKSGVVRLYARWQVYVDPFAPAICAAGNVTFRSDAPTPWTVDASTYRTSPGSARSGVIGDNGRSVLSATLTGPGTLAFFCKVSSEASYDKLTFGVDGTDYLFWSGERGWGRFTVDVPEGSHTVTWKYAKDNSASSGSDCAWVDDVVWTPRGGS